MYTLNLRLCCLVFRTCVLGYDVNECDVMSYCMYPDVFMEYAQFREEFGPVQGLPTRLFFVGPDMGEEFEVEIETGKTLHLKIIAVGDVNKEGKREVFCEVNGQLRAFHVDDKNEVKVSVVGDDLDCVYTNLSDFVPGRSPTIRFETLVRGKISWTMAKNIFL